MVDLLKPFFVYAPDGGGSGGGTDGSGDASGSAASGSSTEGAGGGEGKGNATGSNAAGDAGTNNDNDLGEGGKKALDDERRARRDADRRAKSAEQELEKLRTASMSEQEKAVATAKGEGRTEAMKELGAKLVDAEVRALLAGRGVDAEALLEGVDRSRFVDDKGDPDREALKTWVDRIAPANGTNFPDLGQGARRTSGSSNDMNDLIRSRMRSTR